MPGEVLFTDAAGFVEGLDASAIHDHVRLNALSLDRAAVGREVERGGQFHGPRLGDRQHGLYRALTEARRAHNDRARVILQGAGDDFRGAGRAAVDQHHDGRAGQPIHTAGVVVARRVIETSFCIHDDAACQEQARHIDTRAQHPAGVVAQIQDQALQGLLGLQGVNRVAHIVAGAFLKLRDAQIGKTGFQPAFAHARHADRVALQGEIEGGGLARATDGQHDFTAFGPAHLADRLVDAEPFDGHAIEFENDIAALNARIRRRRTVDGGDNLQITVVHIDLDPQPGKLAGGRGLQIFKGVAVQVDGVRIEPHQHAADGVFQQRAVVDLFDVAQANLIKHIGKGAQLIQGQLAHGRRSGALRPTRRRAQQQHGAQRGDGF